MPGLDTAMDGQFCDRTDKNSVDINRNFPIGYEGQKPGEQVNPGPKALSQPLSQCIQEQSDNPSPDIFLDVHTGQFSLYYTVADKQNQQHHANERKVLNSIIREVCANCRLRQDDLQGVIYVDMKIRKGIKWANLIEVYGGYSAEYEESNKNNYCFVMFNPYDYKVYKYYKRRSYNMMIEYFRSIVNIQFPPSQQKRHQLLKHS